MNLFNLLKKRHKEALNNKTTTIDVSGMKESDKNFLKKRLESEDSVDHASSNLAYLIRMARMDRSQKMSSEAFSHLKSINKFLVENNIIEGDPSEEEFKKVFVVILKNL